MTQECPVCPLVTRRRPALLTSAERVCVDCDNTARQWLTQVESCLTALSPEKGTGGGGGRRAPGFASAAPARLDVLVAGDARTQWTTEDGHGVVAVLCNWAEEVVTERQLSATRQGWPAAVAVLRDNHGWITRQGWAGDYAVELLEIRDTARRLVGLAPEAPVGTCISLECGGPVYLADDRDSARCARCRRVYTGLGVIKLKLARETP